MSSSWVVCKFGGTSVSSRDQWNTIARVVREHLEEGLRPLLVCSAVAGISRALDRMLDDAVDPDRNHLEELQLIRQRHARLAEELEVDALDALSDYYQLLDQLARGAALTGEVTPRLRARVLACGELMLTRLGAAFLSSQELDVQWRDARTLLRSEKVPRHFAHRRYLEATCEAEPDESLQAELAEESDAVLTQGFIASDHAGDTVLLGWGGSDTSAAYLAAKISAQRLEIWTDVPGMFSANPKEIPAARHLRRLGYEEAQELAMTGAEVLHPRSIAPVERQAIPLHIRCTQAPHLEGTVIDKLDGTAEAGIRAVTPRTGLTLIQIDTPTMWQRSGFLADVFGVLKEHNLSVDILANSEAHLTVGLDPQSPPLDETALEVILGDLRRYGQVRSVRRCEAVSLVGRGLLELLPELSASFEALHTAPHGLTGAGSDLNLTLVVGEGEALPLATRLHERLVETRSDAAYFGAEWKELALGEAS